MAVLRAVDASTPSTPLDAPLYGLKRRISQQKHCLNPELEDPDFRNLRFKCLNDCNLSWFASFQSIIERQISGETISGSLHVNDLLSCGKLFEDSSAVPLSVLHELTTIENKNETAFVQQLLQAYPIMHLHLDSPLIINIWQADFFSEDFASYMEGSTSKHSDKETVIVKDMTNKSKNEPVLKMKVGRKPLVEKFPTLIGTATNFIKLDGYSAHARRRISSGSGT